MSGQALNRQKMSEIKYILKNCGSSLLILKCDKFWNWVILVLFYLFLLKHFSLSACSNCSGCSVFIHCHLPHSLLMLCVCGLRTHLSKSCSGDRRLHFPMGFPTSSNHKSPPWVLQRGKGKTCLTEHHVLLVLQHHVWRLHEQENLSPKSILYWWGQEEGVKIRTIAYVTTQFEGSSYSEFLGTLSCPVWGTLAATRSQSSHKSKAGMQSSPQQHLVLDQIPGCALVVL